MFKKLSLDCDLQDVPIATTIVKVHQDAGSKKRSNRKKSGGNTTKVHVVVDALGNPLKVILTAGQVCDVTVTAQLLTDLKTQTLPQNCHSL